MLILCIQLDHETDYVKGIITMDLLPCMVSHNEDVSFRGNCHETTDSVVEKCMFL